MTLIELLVALAVLALLLPGVLAFFNAGSRNVARAGLQTTATALAVDALEEQRRSLLTHVFSHGPGSRTDTPRLGMNRTVSWREARVDAGGSWVSVWELEVVVSYQDERGTARQMTLETFVYPR
jgi:prepilin-type N-terminal cleavage/methylation domain-containing protein